MEIDVFSGSKEQKMTSLQIAEIANRRHSHIMRDIRKMESAWVKIGQPTFGQSSYINSQNKVQPMYELTKKECLYIATKFNDEIRGQLINRWEELETKIRLPKTKLEILEMAMESEKRALALEAKIKEDESKVAFAEQVEVSENSILLGQFSKIDKRVGRNKLFSLLRDNGVLIKRGRAKNEPIQSYVDRGYFEVEESVFEHGGVKYTSRVTLVTGKGQIWLSDFLTKKIGKYGNE